MRARLAIVLVALFAIVAVPSEALLAEQAGSVVDQVTSCRQASGLVRDGAAEVSGGEHCRSGDLALLAGFVAVLVAAGGALAVVPPSSRRRPQRRWSLPVAVARAGAPWRAPPVPV